MANAASGGGGEDVYGAFQNNDEADHASDRIYSIAAGGRSAAGCSAGCPGILLM